MNFAMPVDRHSGSEEAQLVAFQADTAVRSLESRGYRWTYRRCGVSGPPLLILPGALGQADFGYAAISLLGQEFRIIAPDYPPFQSLKELVAGLTDILDAEMVDRAHVLGGSFGGVAAQALARERPERLASLILSHTGAPRRAPGTRIAVKLLAALPEPLLRGLFRTRVRLAVEVAGPFWVRQFDEAVARLRKADLLSRTRLAAEFGDRYGRGSAGERQWPVLLLESADDPLIQASDREALRRLYRDAEVHAFEGTGHLAAILEPEAFAGAIVDFVRRRSCDRGSGR